MYLSKYKIRRSTQQKLVHSTCVVAHLACQFLVRGVGHISLSEDEINRLYNYVANFIIWWRIV